MLKFDGIYCRLEKELNYALRFYEDGLLISQTIQGDLREGFSSLFPNGAWFGREHFNKGSYKLTDSDGFEDIEFTTVSESGKVDYSGTVFEGGLLLNAHSHINGSKTHDMRYFFIGDDVISAAVADNQLK